VLIYQGYHFFKKFISCQLAITKKNNSNIWKCVYWEKLMQLAPIAILAYSRINHLKKTITALQKNTLANKSELYIFLDGAKQGDEKIVDIVRQYIYTIKGFKKVHIFERTTNNLLKNFENGMNKLFDKYSKCIYIDDDIVTAPGFLQFMNDSLEFFKNSKGIISISGYCPPIAAEKYCSDDCFILQRFSAWGFGIWKEKFDLITEVSEDEFKSLMKDKKEIKNFINGGGEDMLPMLEMEVNGEIITTDVKAMFRQYKNHQYTVYPKNSLVQNIGHDDSGRHCGTTNKFDVELWDKIHFKFNHNIIPNKEIIKANFKFRKLAFKDKLTILTKKIGIYSFLKMFIK